tara:strand:+ start:111 stop:698 length:588 start_codon:yes stop_codon:yes gene_type:complete
MKKILGIIVLSLLLSGNSYSKSIIDVVIEKCTDAQYVNEKWIPKSIYENEDVYKSRLNKRQTLLKKYNEYRLIYNATKKKYLKNNPKPKYNASLDPEIGPLNIYDVKEYDIVKVKWAEDELKFMKPFKDKFSDFGKNIKEQDTLIKEIKLSLVTSYLGKIALKHKAKTIEFYILRFKNCEDSHNRTPKGFMLEWE